LWGARSLSRQVQALSWQKVLSDTYIPPKLYFREKQLNALLENPRTNYYCEGEKSTGKTVTVLHFKKRSENENHLVLYVQCQRALTLQLYEAMKSSGIPVKSYDRRHPTLSLFSRSPQENITVILDDAQKVTHFKIFNNFLHDLYENAKVHGKNLRLIIVGTTSYIRFLKYLRDDVKSRFQLKYLIFPKYNATELKQIFTQRLLLSNTQYEEGAISWLCAKIMRLVTDIREGLKVLREACAVAYDDNNKQVLKITKDLLQKVWEPHKTNYWKDHIRGLYKHEKILLLCATKLALQKMRANPFIKEIEISTIEITKLYRKYCYDNNIDPLYPARINYLLKRLCNQDFLIKTSVVSYGRRGRTNKYLYALNPETILNVFNELEEI